MTTPDRPDQPPKKATAGKTVARKTTPDKATARKATPEKTVARKTTADKATARKATPEKAAADKTRTKAAASPQKLEAQAAANPPKPDATAVTAEATVPRARVDEVARQAYRAAPARPWAARPPAAPPPWLRPAPSLPDRIRRDPAPYIVAAVASAIAVITVLKGRRTG